MDNIWKTKIPTILLVQGAPTTCTSPFFPNPKFKIQIIKFTYCYDKDPIQSITLKIKKYTALLTAIKQQGWYMVPILIIAT